MKHSSALLFRSTALLLCIALPAQQLAFASPARRQSPVPQTPTNLTGPVPSQIATAHKIFLSNSGANPYFPFDSTRAYNDIYAALQARGNYQLVGSPAEADLVFQLREVAPRTDYTGADGDLYSYTTPAFRVTILDPKTSVVLWTINSPVTLAGRKQVYEHWIAISETNLVSRIQTLAGQPLTAEEAADLTTVPNYHNRRKALILTGAFVAAAATGGLILHHEYENSLANGKQQQDAFCTANNIPLSMCAGG